MTARPVSTTLRFNRAQAAGDRCLCARVENGMDRAQKAELVSTLHDTFAEIGVVVVTRKLGLTVAQSTDLRAKMRDAGASYTVTKNRLARVAGRGHDYEQLGALRTGPTETDTSPGPDHKRDGEGQRESI